MFNLGTIRFPNLCSDRIGKTECILADLLIKNIFGLKRRLVDRTEVNARKAELMQALRQDNVGTHVIEMLRANKCKHFLLTCILRINMSQCKRYKLHPG